ncbi:MAG: hypothetical protein PHU85_19935 [Phycisphaerae bacterium]|nr:hypothetical protein [Phycisphaerae bacterium]
MTRALAIASLGFFGLIGAGRLLADGGTPAPPANEAEAAARRGTEVLKAVNAGYFHFDPNVQFEAACGVKKDGKAVGKLDLKFFCPGKFQIDFKPDESAGQEDGRGRELFRDAISAAMIEYGITDHGFTGKSQDKDAKSQVAGVDVAVPAGGHVLSLAQRPDSVRQEIYVISPDCQVLQYASEQEDNKPGIRGTSYTVKTRKVDGKYYVESVDRRVADTIGGDANSVREKVVTEFTYMKKDGTPFFKRLEITETKKAAADAQPKTTAWLIETENVTFKKEAAAAGAADPAAAAELILKAYKDKDVGELRKHAANVNQEILGELADQGVKHPRYNSLFGDGWRMAAVTAWDGKVGPVRYRSPTEALVVFGRNKTGYVIVTLVQENDKWCFKDVNNCPQSLFEKAAEKP